MSPSAFKIVLAILNRLRFRMNFRVSFSTSAKSILWNFMEISLNLQMVQGSISILIILSFQFINIDCVSVYLCLLLFLSSVFCGFHCASLLSAWLILKHFFFFFWCYCKWDCFTNFLFRLFIVIKQECSILMLTFYLLLS